MPKKLFIPRRLAGDEAPDRCELCPLIGRVPDEERTPGERRGYYCLGIYEAETDAEGHPVLDADGAQRMGFPKLTSKGIKTSFEKTRESGHLLHRPCDHIWPSWATLPGRLYPMPADIYTRYRLPYEHEQQVKNLPTFKFRRKNGKREDGTEL